MKRMIALVGLGVLLSSQAGCIAVSAKEMSASARYDAVTLDGRIYVVDKQSRTARVVGVVSDEETATP